MAEEKTSTKKRNTRRKRTSTKQQTKSQGFSLRSEVKGLIIIAFAVISLLRFHRQDRVQSQRIRAGK